MTTIHTGNTTSTGFVVTSDNSGDLVLKTGGAGGTTALTIGGTNQQMTLTAPLVNPVPLFSVSLGSDQTGVAGSTDTKVLFDTVDYDLGSYWDTTNKRYLPTIPGYYQFNVVLRCQVGGGSSNLMRVRLDKNGTEQAASYVQSTTNIFINSHVTLSYLIYCNGSDYVEARGYIGTGTTTSRSFGTFVATVGGSSFNGFLVRAA